MLSLVTQRAKKKGPYFYLAQKVRYLRFSHAAEGNIFQLANDVEE